MLKMQFLTNAENFSEYMQYIFYVKFYQLEFILIKNLKLELKLFIT